MSTGGYPAVLATGLLPNQGMLRAEDALTGIAYDDKQHIVVVRTARVADDEKMLRKKARTWGCAVGTVFGDITNGLEGVWFSPAKLRASWLYRLAQMISRTPSLYLDASAIQGMVLCQGDRPLVCLKDLGPHNAIDKVARWMLLARVEAADSLHFITGQVGLEMVLKTAQMGVPILVSWSELTAWGID